MKKIIELCDICLDGNVKTTATRKCITCNKDLCGNESCSGKSYFDDYVPYQLRNNFDFCKECAKKINLLKSEDLKDWFKIGYMSTHSFSKLINEHLLKRYNELADTIKNECTILFTKAIKQADKRYKDQIEKDKRKAEIDREIEMLEKKQRELKNKKL